MEGHSECSLELAWPMIIKQKFAHSGLQSEGKQNQSNHVKSGQKLYCAGKALWWKHFFFFITRDVRTGRDFEITNKMIIA
jgi:hypothetical protein